MSFLFPLEVTDFHDFGLKRLVLPRANEQCQISWKNLTFEMKVAKGRLPLSKQMRQVVHDLGGLPEPVSPSKIRIWLSWTACGRETADAQPGEGSYTR